MDERVNGLNTRVFGALVSINQGNGASGVMNEAAVPFLGQQIFADRKKGPG